MQIKLPAITVLLVLASTSMNTAVRAADLRSLSTQHLSKFDAPESTGCYQNLAQTKADVSEASYNPVYKTDDPHGIVLMMFGLFLIPFSQVLLWKNEKKAVTFAKLISRARKACISVQHNKPSEYNDYSLVHVTGKTSNCEDLCDQEFSVVAENCYRLKRKVEMF